jgi:hypothetical protein
VKENVRDCKCINYFNYKLTRANEKRGAALFVQSEPSPLRGISLIGRGPFPLRGGLGIPPLLALFHLCTSSSVLLFNKQCVDTLLREILIKVLNQFVKC